MKKVKLSTLPKDTIVYIEGDVHTRTVEEVLEDIENYRDEEIYTTKEHYANFNAKDIIYTAIEDEYCNGMYEDWNDSIKGDVTEEDIEDFQEILDRILARNPMGNITYEPDKLIEIDV